MDRSGSTINRELRRNALPRGGLLSSDVSIVALRKVGLQ